MEEDWGGPIGVEWDNLQTGHDCNGNAVFGHGWYVPADNISILEEEGEKFVITDDELKNILCMN